MTKKLQKQLNGFSKNAFSSLKLMNHDIAMWGNPTLLESIERISRKVNIDTII